MAEILTLESTPEVTSVDNLSEEEQDSLQVGEAMQEAQDGLLAGKYKNAQELESAYVELQKKLGEKGSEDIETVDESKVQQTEEVSEEKKETTEDSKTDGILETIWDEASNGEYTKETLEKLQNLTSTDIANEYLTYRKNNPIPTQEMSAQDVAEIKNVAGGEQEYNSMLKWAQSNLNEKEIDMFDTVMSQGNPLAAFFAVRSLAYRYEDARGVDGTLVTGTAPKTSGDQFRSQAELVAAMGDKRYDNDPAYRMDVMQKLERSNVNF
tara:strand:- start:425 stop:1225 length:801 start_codon:yes stop_codon:yes gene_type:complete